VEEPGLAKLHAARPAIKREWETLLRAEPTLSPLGHPDTLVFLMDETLDQLQAGLQVQPLRDWLSQSPALVAPLQRSCLCRINPLLNYYTTGELAVRAATVKVLPPEDVEEAVLIFHALAQQEIETLCSVCRHPPGADCQREQWINVRARKGH
jgi:hypothetical protein